MLTWIENEMQDLLAKKADASNEEIENQIDQNYQELLKIQREYSSDPYQYYYQLMLVHPDIAQNWFNTRPTYRAALSNTAYFPDGTAELFQGDEQE